MALEVRADHLAEVQRILREHVPEREVWAFGSRVQGRARATSDLDLCVIGDEPLPYDVAGRLRMAFSESNLPFLIDVVDWAAISAAFREVIRAERVVIQPTHMR